MDGDLSRVDCIGFVMMHDNNEGPIAPVTIWHKRAYFYITKIENDIEQMNISY